MLAGHQRALPQPYSHIHAIALPPAVLVYGFIAGRQDVLPLAFIAAAAADINTRAFISGYHVTVIRLARMRLPPLMAAARERHCRYRLNAIAQRCQSDIRALPS